MKLLGLFCLAIGLLGVAACESKTESLSYQLSYNGCDTGKHDYDSKDAYCTGLKDYRANNNGCAYSLRKQTYEDAGCPGDFEEQNR